jgi:hypothetical protein
MFNSRPTCRTSIDLPLYEKALLRQANGAELADSTNQLTPRLGGFYGGDGGFWRRFLN